jgi:hypothetical protein
MEWNRNRPLGLILEEEEEEEEEVLVIELRLICKLSNDYQLSGYVYSVVLYILAHPGTVEPE